VEEADLVSRLVAIAMASNIHSKKVQAYQAKDVDTAGTESKTSSIMALDELMAYAELLSSELPVQDRTPKPGVTVASFLPFLGQNGFKEAFNKKYRNILSSRKAGITADIGLFGRMMASATDLDVKAASSFSHSISTHASANQQDFYVCKGDDEDAVGSDMMGHQSFAASVMYGCCHLDLDLLAKNLAHHSHGDRQRLVAAFIEAVVLSRSEARKNGMSANQLPAYVRVTVSNGQTLEADFTTPVTAAGEGILPNSIGRLRLNLEQTLRFMGPARAGVLLDLEYEAGSAREVTLDDLVAGVIPHVV
jgi:hypothetical protein